MVQENPTLKGKTVAITRAMPQAQETAKLIKKMGGKPWLIPTLEFKLAENLLAVERFIEALYGEEVDYTLFMSANVLRFLFEAAEKLGLAEKLKEGLKRTTILAVGPKTAEELKKYEINVDVIPEEYSSEGVVRTLQKFGVSGKTLFIPRVRGASSKLKNMLVEMGGKVEEVYVYEQKIPKNSRLIEKFMGDLAAGKIDAIVFGSSQSIRNLFQILETKTSKKTLEMLKCITIVAIGPETAKTLREMGLKVDVTPKNYTFEEALKALALHWA